MILEDDTPLHVHNPKKIKRKHCGVVFSEPETKEYKVVFKKRRLMDNFIYTEFYLSDYLFIGVFIYTEFYLYMFIYLFIQIFIY